MSLFGIFRRRPPHCTTCGDQMQPHEYRRSYSQRDGSPVMFHGWRCPRSDDRMPFGDHGDGYRINCMYPPPWATEEARRAYYDDHKPFTSVPNWQDKKWKAPVA